jgi:hypothetical protein
MEEKNSSLKKGLRNAILFIGLIFLTFYIIFKDQSIADLLSVLKGVNKTFILVAIICMFLYFCCESINKVRILKMLGEKTSFLKNLKYTLICFFFSSVTPAASGGQPMEIYYMHKDGINVANATLSLLINLTSIQIVTISVALVSLCFNYQYMNTILIIFFIIGILLNSSALALLLISIFSKRMSKGIINFAVKVLKFFKIKNVEKKQEWLEGELNKYQASASYIKTHKKLIIKTILITYVQFLFYYSISYWVYCSFGYSNYNILQISSMQAVLYATVSGIPSPGAVGVSEGGFLEIFKSVYTKNEISGAMLLSRGVNFYLFVLISVVIVMFYTMKDKSH